MQILILTLAVATCLVAGVVHAKPLDASDAAVEIVKQKLVKFPEDLDRPEPPQTPETKDSSKSDEAKRILAEIAKINQALGYVKKQPDQPKLPPILDSSQYLFPQPSFHPFHSQNHQAAGSNGETILIPSIRSFDFNSRTQLADFNVPPTKRPTAAAAAATSNTPASLMSLHEYQSYLSRQHQDKQPQQPVQQTGANESQKTKAPASPQTLFYYRPNQVAVPAPQSGLEQSQLPAHFVIPVRLYKLNKEEYIQKYAPQEYRVKGYKIVGDIDNFYGKAKSKGSAQSASTKAKTTPKYHLFFLPREIVLNEDSTFRTTPTAITIASDTQDAALQSNDDTMAPKRDEKLTNRPYKLAPNAKPTQTGALHQGSGTTLTPHNVKKRVGTKPVKEHKSTTTVTPSSVEAHITVPPTKPAQVTTTSSSAHKLPNDVVADNKKPIAATIRDHDTPDSHPIKTAFQNIFKFPFRQEARPQPAETASPLLQSHFFGGSAQALHRPTAAPRPQDDNDYRWEDDYGDDANSNSAADDSAASDAQSQSAALDEHEEKHIFGHRHHQQHQTQNEALRQGGIIIQKLKVRKGGIAIAGPGGVATAGSGGTAIVGPGGYALTHPRSLTIAGPGAKIIAIPPNIDLKDALRRTNLKAKTFPREGKIVATGPTVYYAPAVPDAGAVVL